jgi:hypothetical protein
VLIFSLHKNYGMAEMGRKERNEGKFGFPLNCSNLSGLADGHSIGGSHLPCKFLVHPNTPEAFLRPQQGHSQPADQLIGLLVSATHLAERPTHDAHHVLNVVSAEKCHVEWLSYFCARTCGKWDNLRKDLEAVRSSMLAALSLGSKFQ